ncbi:hypothetical protein T12_8998 [Trichinella patagoniensis]|uniref:Uncharacterized protein n=1 Tax=Trichinella patagoniensis TaxID=990121 RepID=A0A0V0ZME7_9BILA|nr:hypothetical protein T12_8998 [Trichinella patagoniensis]
MKKLLYLVVRRPSDTRPSTNNAHVSLFRSNLTFTKNDKIMAKIATGNRQGRIKQKNASWRFCL